ncbi:hypothetical protein [Streptomyces sp. NPDC026589]|uniref:hypothetical protein n=1 Tax=Streptomyces sp. NPDC026589 TaxID=3155609 RepID=UPI003410F348
MELERRNCWTLAQALGHDGPYRLQRFLSRGAWNHDLAREHFAAWTAGNSPALRPCWSSTRRAMRTLPPTA